MKYIARTRHIFVYETIVEAESYKHAMQVASEAPRENAYAKLDGMFFDIESIRSLQEVEAIKSSGEKHDIAINGKQNNPPNCS